MAVGSEATPRYGREERGGVALRPRAGELRGAVAPAARHERFGRARRGKSSTKNSWGEPEMAVQGPNHERGKVFLGSDGAPLLREG
eukprot:7026740-Prymnesium_polylepis.1